MDFLTKFLQLTPSKSGSGSPGTKASSTPCEKDHETNVEFAREFVEELVENIPAKTGTDQPLKEDTSRYSLALSDISVLSDSSLPDLLQPEAQYKKLAETDTDTTDYESAAESDAVSLNASLGLDRSDIVSSPDVLDATRIISPDLSFETLQIDADTFEDAETSLREPLKSPGLDISALCLDVQNKLCLETPKRLAENSLEDSFLVTLRQDSDTSLNTTEGDVQSVFSDNSFAEKSFNESSLESGPLSESIVLSVVEVSTEHNLQIIQALDFEEEKPAETGTVDVKSPVQEASVQDAQIPSTLVDPLNESEAAEVPPVVKPDETVLPVVKYQATVTEEILGSEPHVASTETKCVVLDDVSVNVPELLSVESESLSAATVEPVSDKLEKSLISNISVQEVQEATSPLHVGHLPIQAEVSPLTEPEFAPSNESVLLGDSGTEVLPILETELQLATADIVENTSVSEKEASKDPEPPENAEVSSVVKLASTVEPLSTSLTEPIKTEPILKTSVVPSNIPVQSEVGEVSPILEPQLSTSIVDSQLSSSCVDATETESIVAPVISKNEPVTAEVSSITEQLQSTFIVESPETEPILTSVSSLNEPEKVEVSPITEQLQSTSIVETEPIVEPINSSNEPEKAEVSPIFEQLQSTSIVKRTVTEPIFESIKSSNEPEKVEVSPVAEQVQSTPIVELTETVTAPNVIVSREPELLSVCSELVNSLPVKATQEVPSSDPIFTSQGIAPALPEANLPRQPEDFPVPIPVSVPSPLLAPKLSVVTSQESTDIIDPVDAVWSASSCTDSSFDKTHLIDPFSLNDSVKQKQTSPTGSKSPVVQPELYFLQREVVESSATHTKRSPLKAEQTVQAVAHPFVNATHLTSNGPSGDAFSPIPVKSTNKLLSQCLESGDTDFIFKKPVQSAKPVNDPSLNDLREICQRQQRELDNQRFNSDFFGDNLYDNIQADSIAAEAAKVSEDIHNASIELVDSEMDENVNPVPLDKKWLSERRGEATKLDETRSKTIGAGGDGFAESLDKRNKNVMSSSIDAQTNQSEAGPEIALQDDEIFTDSAGFDFLSAKNSTGPSDRLVRESLYTKFDPLAAPTPASAPVSRHAPLPMPPKFSETPSSTPSPSVGQLIAAPAAPPTPPKGAITNEGPTEVTPSKNSARALVDRLISLSPAGRVAHESPVKPPPPVVVKAPSTQTPEEMAEELLLLRELLGAEEMSYNVTLTSLQEKLKNSELELLSTKQKVKAGEEREQKLLARLGERVQAQKQLTAVMGEYEKTISKLVGEKEIERATFQKEKEDIMKEKDTALGHLTNIEIAFSDVHQKYERCKTIVEAFKSNETVLRESLTKYEALIHKQEQKYEMLKAHAMTQLENANQELDAVKRAQATEGAKLKAMLKKSELKTSSLEEMLEQKVKENLELASICDDLIAKVGT